MGNGWFTNREIRALQQNGAVFEILANPVALVRHKPEFESVGELTFSANEMRGALLIGDRSIRNLQQSEGRPVR